MALNTFDFINQIYFQCYESNTTKFICKCNIFIGHDPYFHNLCIKYCLMWFTKLSKYFILEIYAPQSHFSTKLEFHVCTLNLNIHSSQTREHWMYNVKFINHSPFLIIIIYKVRQKFKPPSITNIYSLHTNT